MSLSISTERKVTLDPITVEVIGATISSIAEETGEALIRASYSTNIKERRDCSTALFDAQGHTLCQAEHIPIHLGSLIGIVSHVLKLHSIADIGLATFSSATTPTQGVARTCLTSSWPSPYSSVGQSSPGRLISRIMRTSPIAATRTSIRRACAYRPSVFIAPANYKKTFSTSFF